MSRGSSAHTIACGSKTTRPPASCTLKVVNVSSASEEVSISPPIASKLSRRSSCAPPARHACAPSTFCARRAPACALMYSNEMKRFMKLAGRLPSLMYAVTAPTVGIAEMAHHPAQRAAGEDHVGVDDQHRLVPALGADLAQPVVERVGLALAALGAAQVEDPARVLARPCPSTTSGVSSVLASSTT